MTNEVDAYNPVTQTWRKLAPLPSTRNDAAVTVGADGTIYCDRADMTTPGQAMSNEVDAYDPATKTWTVSAAPAECPHALAATTGKDGTIYAIGGATATGFNSTEVDAYNPVTRTWTVLGSELAHRARLAGGGHRD